jgi:hypothetical protein
MLRTVGVLIGVAVGLVACSPGSESSGSATPGGASPAGSAAADWTTLFDGSSLAGWTKVGDANWQLMDGAVMANGGTGFLLSAKTYDDFDLQLEFFVSPDANSGVFVRCANPAEIGAATCYEVNIFDQRPDPAYRTGAIVDVAKPSVMLETGNKWNSYEISARGKRLVVKLNGQTTVDVEDDKFAAGPLALQYGAGQVMFRNVRIRAE